MSEAAASLQPALDQLARGGTILLTGDRLRDGDIDFVAPARGISAATIVFLGLHGRGLICLAITPERALRLGIGLPQPYADGRIAVVRGDDPLRRQSLGTVPSARRRRKRSCGSPSRAKICSRVSQRSRSTNPIRLPPCNGFCRILRGRLPCGHSLRSICSRTNHILSKCCLPRSRLASPQRRPCLHHAPGSATLGLSSFCARPSDRNASSAPWPVA